MCFFSEVTPENELINSCLFDKMLNFTKTVSCSVIGTAQQIDTKLMHRFEKFRKNLLAKFYSMKDFIFLTHQMNSTGKNFNIGSLKPCHVLLKQSSENVFVFR